jgi:hypothetical protein
MLCRMAEHELCRKLFAKLQRQLAAQERCVLVVDTSQQGWKVGQGGADIPLAGASCAGSDHARC